MYREIALPARMASLFPTYKIGVVCQEGRIGALLALGDGEKLILSRSNKPEVKTAMKTWAIVVGVLIVLFCLSYMVRHPGTVNQTFAKVFPHNGAETP
jgi:hypothetical protein